MNELHEQLLKAKNASRLLEEQLLTAHTLALGKYSMTGILLRDLLYEVTKVNTRLIEMEADFEFCLK